MDQSAPASPRKPDWAQLARDLRIDGRAQIDGARTDAAHGAQFECRSPIDGRVLAQVARCDAADVDRAVTVARRAFDDRRWVGKAPAVRKDVLLKFSQLMLAHRDELALLETLDMGKPIRYSRATDVPLAANTVRWYGEAIDKVYDEIAPTADTALALITREPVGVVACVVPWNYPMLMATWKFAPALAAGNCVILKPSEKSPLSALRLADLALEAGVPPGVFQVLPGYGGEAGEALALHMDVDCIAFTGSTRTGKLIAQMAGRSNLKRVWTELGGKSANIICADCVDLDTAVDAALSGIFFNAGESCNAPSRLFVERSIKEAFLERALQRLPRYEPADPLDPKTVMGAIVDEPQFTSVMGYIERGREEGARVIAGGEAARRDTGGWYVRPTIFDEVRNTMTIAREEIFGPVLSVIALDEVDDAIRQANDSSYGLAAGVWTRELSTAHRIARALRAGTVHVNSYDEDDITVPFGGYKQSGNGRDKSLHALEKYTELKTIWIKL